MAEETPLNPPAGDGDGDTKINAENQDGQQKQINNPEAFYKAEAEKWERLFKKTSDELTTAQTMAKALQDEQKKAVEAMVNDALAKLEAEKSKIIAEAEAEKVKALRTRLVVAQGLDAELAEFLTGTDESTIAEQVKKLVEKVKPKAPNLRTGNNLGGDKSSGGRPSWMGTSSTFGGGGVISPED